MMEQRGKLFGLMGFASFFMALGSFLTITTLLKTVEPQWQQWARMVVTFISFSAGVLFIEMAMRMSKQGFNEAFAKRERELGRPLLPDECEEVKKATHAAMTDVKGPGFNAPLVQLIASISLVVVPAVLLSVVVASIGAFLAGFGVALLLNALTGRILDDSV